MTQPAQQAAASSSWFSKTFLAISFAAFIALAPAPVFAQHGGGGGGGGGSHGGGGGGSHASSGGGGHASTGSSHTGSGSHPTSANTGGNPANPNGGGHWWNPFHSNSGNSEAKSGTNSGARGTSDGNTRFAATNNVWQDPPANNTRATTNYYAAANRSAASSTAKPVRNTFANNPRAAGISQNVFHRHIYYPYYPYGFYPYSYGFGFGYGFGCDPLWGCPPGFGYGFGYGLGYGAGFGYGGGDFGYYSGAPDYSGSDMNFNATTPSSSPEDLGTPEGNAGDWQDVPVDNSQQNNANARPYVVLILRDGSSYAVSDYWLAGGKLHYVTSYGGENSIDANQLDLQRTVNENALRGVTFTLRPAPAANGPTDQQNPRPSSPANSPSTPAPNPQ
jgi:hypothetical protein